MKILALNGSPGGSKSLSLQYFLFLKKTFPQHQFETLNIASEIQEILEKTEKLDAIIKKIKEAQAIVWVFPVYYFLVPSQLKSFIEKLFENEAMSAFHGKYSTAITTSAHLFDHTAHQYIRAVSEDLRMKTFDGISLEGADLAKEDIRPHLVTFFRFFLDATERKAHIEKRFEAIKSKPFDYQYQKTTQNVGRKTQNVKITLVTDIKADDHNLENMIRALTDALPVRITTINLHEINIKKGCIGCCRCTWDNVCLINDGYDQMFDSAIVDANAIIFASKIKDRYLSSQIKQFFDRSFIKGHTPILKDKQIGFLISGPLRQMPLLREILEAKVEIFGGNLCACITDEDRDSARITALIQALADRIMTSLERGYVKPMTFTGLATHCLGRDMVYSASPILHADHVYYKKHGIYNFPNRDSVAMLKRYFLNLAMKNTKTRKKIYARLRRQRINEISEYL